jgi:DNA-binding MarR family transcriptional regulator
MPAWIAFLRAHSSITRRLNADLQGDHGLTLNDYEVLLHLSRAPDRALRRVDLVERVLLTPSGITRLLEGLERAGFVARKPCQEDARVVYAELTDAGEEKFRAARATHLAGVQELFAEPFAGEELDALAGLLQRLPACVAD